MKKCSKCGVEKELSEFSKCKDKKDGLQPSCKSCRAIKNKEWYEKNKENKKKYDYNRNRTIEGRYNTLKSNAKPRGLEVQISLEQYTEILKENKCFYCDMTPVGAAGHSLNRIDSSKGYLVSNVKPCCKFCNTIMSNFTKEELKTRVYKIIKRME